MTLILPRRTLLQGLAAGTAAMAFPVFIQAQSSAPIKLGFQLHRTGSGRPMAAGTSVPRRPH